MSKLRKINKMLRGNVSLKKIFLEAFRLQKAKLGRKREKRRMKQINDAPARLANDFASLSQSDLLAHFRRRINPRFFFSGDFKELSATARLSSDTERILENARRIVNKKRWALAGFGEMDFNRENFWRLDPLGKIDWGLDYHGDLKYAGRGADVRILWELNRFGHALTLAQSYLLTKDEVFAEEFFSQIESWQKQNPYVRGANWGCAMEVALRAMNLLVAFEIFRHSPVFDETKLSEILRLFDQHGRFIVDNSEFSYVSTSNHYLSNAIGLLWLGVLLPELEKAEEWRQFGFREMLGEMDNQVLADGADYESSTGYHRLVTELFLYSFLLCRRNNLEIPEKYRKKLCSMLEYVRGYLRPDGLAPLIGDTDGGQVLPFVKREGDDHAYLLAISATLFEEANFKVSNYAAPEILWTFGEAGLKEYEKLKSSEPPRSSSFPEAGMYVMRDGDIYLNCNTSDCGLNGRGSHGHNDALSVEIAAFDTAFIVDPGTYVYNLDLDARHRFRSTAYHATVQIDDREQSSIDAGVPFVIGNEARPRALRWESDDERDLLVAEHYGYTRLSDSIVHRRTVEFDKGARFWIIEDSLSGKEKHRIHFRFHVAPDLKIKIENKAAMIIAASGNKLFIKPFNLDVAPEIDRVWVSRNYGERRESSLLRWTLNSRLPLVVRFAVVPLRANEESVAAFERVRKFL